jgi:hypothetical protein
MIEYFIAYGGAKSVGGLAARKGYAEWPFVMIFALLWFCFGMLGMTIGLVTNEGRNGIMAVYAMALGMELFGAFLGFLPALLVPPRNSRMSRKRRRDPRSDSLVSPSRSRRQEEEDEDQPRRGRRRRYDETELPRPRPPRDDDVDEVRPRKRRRADDSDFETERRSRARRKDSGWR